MAVGPSDISGNDWCGLENSSQAADRMSDENFTANPVFLDRKLSLGPAKMIMCILICEEVKKE